MKKEDLKEALQKDLSTSQGALREIIEHNRIVNKSLVEQMTDGDFTLLEEYGIITKGILDSVKLLNEINSVAPKTIKDINTVQEEKKGINLRDLIDE